MFDIDLYMKMNPVRKALDNGEKLDRDHLAAMMEEFRGRKPVVYNIETTNACNMRCEMCPRTTMMTRSIETIDRETFIRIVDQLEPFGDAKWQEWERFVEAEYGVKKTDMSENHFFLHVIPKVIQLHGYGDPLLDSNMPEYVRILSEKKMYSYFSCNPSNINIEKMTGMLENGLDYIKYSIETVDDVLHKKIRGKASDFTRSYEKICELLRIKKENNYKTTIIITMLNLNRQNQMKEYELLEKAFDGLDVYIYLKSEDQQWYRKDYHGTNSVHWSEYCKHPWMSMTIKSNGEATTCMEDFNNEIVLGDARKASLADIWNGERYRKLRMDHFLLTEGIKCTAQCDMKLIGNYFSM